jgi:hypothetical protein
MSEKVYIIILNYKGWKDTIECLESALKIDYENFQIIVVDNNSPDNSLEKLISWAKGDLSLDFLDKVRLKKFIFPLEKKPLSFIFYKQNEAIHGNLKDKESANKKSIIFIQAEQNLGFASGNNIGIKYAFKKNDFDYLWLLNNDTVLPPKTLKNWLLFLSKDKTIQLSGCVNYHYWSPNNIVGICGNYSDWQVRSWHIRSESTFKKSNPANFYPIGSSMICAKSFIDKVGFLDESYFLYFEELDWVERAKKRQIKIGFTFANFIYHKEGASIGIPSKKNFNPLSVFYLARSHRKFVKKHKSLLKRIWFYILYSVRIVRHFLLYKEYARLLYYAIYTEKSFKDIN